MGRSQAKTRSAQVIAVQKCRTKEVASMKQLVPSWSCPKTGGILSVAPVSSVAPLGQAVLTGVAGELVAVQRRGVWSACMVPVLNSWLAMLL